MVFKFVHYSYLFIVKKKRNGRSMAAVYNGGKVSIQVGIPHNLQECSRMHCRFHLDVILGANQISQWQGARFERSSRCKSDRWRRTKQLSSRHLHLSSALRTKSIEHGREYKVTLDHLLLSSNFTVENRGGELFEILRTKQRWNAKNVFRCTISLRKQIHI